MPTATSRGCRRFFARSRRRFKTTASLRPLAEKNTRSLIRPAVHSSAWSNLSSSAGERSSSASIASRCFKTSSVTYSSIGAAGRWVLPQPLQRYSGRPFRIAPDILAPHGQYRNPLRRYARSIRCLGLRSGSVSSSGSAVQVSEIKDGRPDSFYRLSVVTQYQGTLVLPKSGDTGVSSESGSGTIPATASAGRSGDSLSIELPDNASHGLAP